MKAATRRTFTLSDALRRIGLQPAATVYVQSVVEEESTGNGALMTHLPRLQSRRRSHSRARRRDSGTSERRCCLVSVEVRGLPVHVREMGLGANAINVAYRIIGELCKTGNSNT